MDTIEAIKQRRSVKHYDPAHHMSGKHGEEAFISLLK